MTSTFIRQVLDIIVHELNLSGDPPLDQPLLNVGADSLDSINIQVALEDKFLVSWSHKEALTPDQTPLQIAERLTALINQEQP